MWVFISIFLSSAKVKSTVVYTPGVLELSYGQGIEPREFINWNRKKKCIFIFSTSSGNLTFPSTLNVGKISSQY